MNRTLLFSIGTATILIVFTMNFSIYSSMAFSQNSNQNVTMGQSPMVHQINQTGLTGMESQMLMGEAVMMPCLMTGEFMMGDQTMMAIMSCIVNPSMSGQIGQPPMLMGQPPMLMGQPPMLMGQPPMLMGQPPMLMGQPPMLMGQPPMLMGQPPMLMGQPPMLMGQPPMLMGQPPMLMGQPPMLMGQPPMLMGQPPMLMGQPPMLMGQPPIGQTDIMGMSILAELNK